MPLAARRRALALLYSAALLSVVVGQNAGNPCSHGNCLEEIHFKGDLNSPEMVCAHVNVYGGGDKALHADEWTNSLRLNAEVVDTDHASTFELVATKIKVVTGELFLQGVVDVTGSIHYTTSVKLTVPDVDSAFIETGASLHVPPDVSHAGQWQQVLSDTFDGGNASGWTHVGNAAGASNRTGVLTACNDGNRFLGGHCATGAHESRKVVRDLPPHSELHLTARFHFIDAWDGETAFAKVDGSYVWMDSHEASPSPINLCGGLYGDSRIGSVIDIIVPHTADSASITFGALLDGDACEESWGVDDVLVQVR